MLGAPIKILDKTFVYINGFLDFKGGGPGSFQYIRAEKHVLLQNCRNYTEDGTSFSECVAISAMNSTGCKVNISIMQNKRFQTK